MNTNLVVNLEKENGGLGRAVILEMLLSGNLEPLKGIKKLSLYHLGLSSIPEGIFHLDSLEELDLSCNHIYDYSNIYDSNGKCRLQGIRIINLNNNGLYKFPEFIFDIESLEEAYLNYNDFRSIPKKQYSCKKLRVISIKNNTYFQSIPCEILTLKSLETFKVSWACYLRNERILTKLSKQNKINSETFVN